MPKGLSRTAKEAEKAFKEAVEEAIDKHAKNGIPAVFMKGDKLCYKMPDGKIQYTTPKNNKK